MELAPGARREEQVGRELPTAERQHDGKDSVRQGNTSGPASLGGLHADAFGVGSLDAQGGGVAQGDVTNSEGASFGPAEPGPAHHDQDVSQALVVLLPGQVARFQFGLAPWAHLHAFGRRLRNPDARHRVGRDEPFSHAPREEAGQAGAVADH